MIFEIIIYTRIHCREGFFVVGDEWGSIARVNQDWKITTKTTTMTTTARHDTTKTATRVNGRPGAGRQVNYTAIKRRHRRGATVDVVVCCTRSRYSTAARRSLARPDGGATGSSWRQRSIYRSGIGCIILFCVMRDTYHTHHVYLQGASHDVPYMILHILKSIYSKDRVFKRTRFFFFVVKIWFYSKSQFQ